MRAARPPAGAAAGARGREAGNGRSTPSRARGAGGGGRASPIHTGLPFTQAWKRRRSRQRQRSGRFCSVRIGARATVTPARYAGALERRGGHKHGVEPRVRRPRWLHGVLTCASSVHCVALSCSSTSGFRPPGALTFLLTIHDSEKPTSLAPKKHNSFYYRPNKTPLTGQGCVQDQRPPPGIIWGCGGFRR